MDFIMFVVIRVFNSFSCMLTIDSYLTVFLVSFWMSWKMATYDASSMILRLPAVIIQVATFSSLAVSC